MTRKLITDGMVLLFCAFALALAAVAGTSSSPAPQAYDAPVKRELQEIFGKLSNQVKIADALAARLRETAARGPEDTGKIIDGAEYSLGTIADTLAPNGRLASDLMAVRNAAAVHYKRVQQMPKGTIDENGRTAAINAWQDVTQKADRAAAAMTDMRTKVLDVLQQLRERRAAVSELMLAGQYQAAIDALTHWLSDLGTTVNGLHQALVQIGLQPPAPGS